MPQIAFSLPALLHSDRELNAPIRTVPAAGVYANVPGTDAVASSCVPLSAVPYVMSAGFAQVIVGVAFPTVSGSVTLVLAPNCVPLTVAAENDAATLCEATDNADGL